MDWDTERGHHSVSFSPSIHLSHTHGSGWAHFTVLSTAIVGLGGSFSLSVGSGPKDNTMQMLLLISLGSEKR